MPGPQVPVDVVRPGEVLSGKFRIERVLGVGGMGVVVAATHLQLGQLVALKFLLPAAMAYPENVSRFEREARAAVRLRSDHVAKVTDVGRLDDGAPYMVMEFLEGQDLDQVVRAGGALPIQTAADYVLQACEAIAEAHGMGIVHRDLKPKNLFLTRRLNGEALIKVLDFGVSKVVGGDDLSLTNTTQVLGSPSYMSPEQLRASRDVDQRTDIWALGAILYELLSGSVPFPAATLTQLTAMVISEPPRPLESLRADVPDALRAIVLKCLEKPVLARYQTVVELAAELASFGSPSSRSLAIGPLGATVPSVPPRADGSGPSPPFTDRPSFRAPGGSTSVAWDQTQMAAGKPTRKLPILVGVAAASALLGAIAVWSRLHPQPRPILTPAASITAPMPSVRDPNWPPVIPGVERPPPSSLIPATTAPTREAPHVVAPTQRRDAGHTSPAASGGSDLPTTRN